MIGDFWQDLRYAARRLWQAPAFVLLVVVTLGLGIGANGSIFTLVNALVLRPLPVADPEQLVQFSPGDEQGRGVGGLRTRDGRVTLFSHPLYERLRDGAQGLSLAAQDCNLVSSIVRGQDPGDVGDSAGGRAVSANFFEVLGVPAHRGRMFSSASDRPPSSSAVVVLSHRYWQRRFAGDEGLIGQTLAINGTRYTVTGVAPPGFSGANVGGPADFWVNLDAAEAFTRYGVPNENPEYSWLQLFGRLGRSATIEAAQANANVILTPFLLESPTRSEGGAYHIELQPGATGFSLLRERFREPLVVLMAGVVVLLLIVCLNVSHLLLARAMSREHEMSIRVALGATRARLARQLLVEGFLLAALGALAGAIATRWLTMGLLWLALGDADPTPSGISFAADGRMLPFVAVLVLSTSLLLALVPAWHAWRTDLQQSIRATSQAVAAGSLRRASRVLMVSQVAFSMLLLTSAGLLAASLDKLREVVLGIDREHVLLAGVNVSAAALDDERTRLLYEELPRRIGALPGVRAASLSMPPVLGGWQSRTVTFPGTALPETVLPFYLVTPGYFEALGMRILRGRAFSAYDNRDAPRVAVVNETMAANEFGGRDAIGQRISLDQVNEIEIIGVVSDARTRAVQRPSGPVLYLPAAQTHGERNRLWLTSLTVRGSGDPALLTDQVRRAVAEAQPGLPLLDIRTLSEQVDRVLVKERVLATLASAFGLGALFLVAVGLYGVISQWATQRTREIGVRMALGATAARVQWLVLRQALGLVLAGLALGVPAALGVARSLEGLLFEVEPLDPLVLLAAALTLLAVATLAAYLPARRASRVDPVIALRSE